MSSPRSPSSGGGRPPQRRGGPGPLPYPLLLALLGPVAFVFHQAGAQPRQAAGAPRVAAAGSPGVAASAGAATAPAGGAASAGAGLAQGAARMVVILGKVGTKARGTSPDLTQRLREAILRELRESNEVEVLESETAGKGRFTIDSSITELTRRLTPNGEWEVTCEVSVVIGMLPSRSIVGMTSGGATIQVPRRAARLTKAAAMALETDALNGAVRGANQNLLEFLRHQK